MTAFQRRFDPSFSRLQVRFVTFFLFFFLLYYPRARVVPLYAAAARKYIRCSNRIVLLRIGSVVKRRPIKSNQIKSHPIKSVIFGTASARVVPLSTAVLHIQGDRAFENRFSGESTMKSSEVEYPIPLFSCLLL